MTQGKSRIPEPMSIKKLIQYQWLTKLTKPAVIATPIPQLSPLTMHIGQTSAKHVFANGKTGLPAIKSTVWGYGAAKNAITYPGPTLEAIAGVLTQVKWGNCLPLAIGPAKLKHPFVMPPKDAIPGGSMMARYDVGHTAVHLHGAHLEWTSDGYPMRHPDMPAPKVSVLRPGGQVTFDYPNTQAGGATLWYHDHTMDMTARNVYAGLAGAYLLRHKDEADVFSPLIDLEKFEFPLIIQDRSFTKEGELLYGDASYLTLRKSKRQIANNTTRPDVIPAPSPEFKGQAFVVNGVLWPHMDVEPRAYRFRVLNGCNSRMVAMRVSPESASMPGSPERSLNTAPGISILQIGADGGMFDQIVEINGLASNGASNTDGEKTLPPNLLILAPGERADIVIDFSKHAGKKLYLSNHATDSAPLGNGGDGVPDLPIDPKQQTTLVKATIKALGAIVQFRVNQQSPKELEQAKLNCILKKLAPANATPPTPADLDAATLKRAYRIVETPTSFQASDVNPSPKSSAQTYPPGRFGWKAITFQSVLGKLPFGPELLWAGARPSTGIGGVPAGGPKLENLDLTGNASAHRINGCWEIWEFYNDTGDVHPIHLHLSQFKIIDRQALTLYDSEHLRINNDRTTWVASHAVVQKPDTNESGWKDTVRVNPRDLTRILVKFDNGSDKTNRDYSGDFVWHCHLLEHEDMGMMRPLKIHPLTNNEECK